LRKLVYDRGVHLLSSWQNAQDNRKGPNVDNQQRVSTSWKEKKHMQIINYNVHALFSFSVARNRVWFKNAMIPATLG